jgi:hypothetical protein
VHPLTAFVRADEQHADGPGDHRPLAWVTGPEAARLAGHVHPPQLVGDDVDVADHESHDLHELSRHPQPLESGEKRARLGGRRQQEAGQHTQGALREQPPGCQQAVL